MAKKTKIINPATGCRADTVFGLWLAPVERLETWVNTAWGVIERGEIKTYQERSIVLNEETEESSHSIDQNGIVNVSLSGPLTKHSTSFSSLFGGTSTMQVRKRLQEIRNDPMVKGVFIEADSWGGTVEGNSELVEAIRQTAAVKPMICHAEDKATSAMLWAACAAPVFTCGDAATVGSLGTMCKLYDSTEFYKQGGVKPVIITTGEFKAIGAPGLPVTDKHKEELQRYVNSLNLPFRSSVQADRKLSDDTMKEICTARLYVGADAVQMGLCDKVCSTDQAYQMLLERVQTGTVTRGPVPVTKTTTAAAQPAGSPRRIMLTPTQLEAARKLPGCSAISADGSNADEILFNAVTSVSANNSQLTASVTAKDTEIATLKQTAKPKADASIVRGHAQLAHQEVDLLVKKDVLKPAQADPLKKVFMDGETPNEILCTPGADGKPLYKSLLAVFEMNSPSGVLTPVSGGQPAPKTEPGSTDKEEKPPTIERKNSLLAHVGVAPAEAKA